MVCSDTEYWVFGDIYTLELLADSVTLVIVFKIIKFIIYQYCLFKICFIRYFILTLSVCMITQSLSPFSVLKSLVKFILACTDKSKSTQRKLVLNGVK